MAGAEGIEPPLQVLETWVLPLNDAPSIGAGLETAVLTTDTTPPN